MKSLIIDSKSLVVGRSSAGSCRQGLDIHRGVKSASGIHTGVHPSASDWLHECSDRVNQVSLATYSSGSSSDSGTVTAMSCVSWHTALSVARVGVGVFGLVSVNNERQL